MRKLAIIVFSTLIAGCANVQISPGAMGVVTDRSGKPLQATVELTHKQVKGKSKSTSTDEEGNYSMSGLRVWTPIPFSAIRLQATVIVSAPGYKPHEYPVEGMKTLPENVQLEAE